MHHTPDATASILETLSFVRDLNRSAARQSSGCLWVEGIRQFVQAYDAGFTFHSVIHSPILLKSPLPGMLTRRLGKQGVRRVKVSPEQFRQISTTKRASGIGAIVHQRWTPLESIDPTVGLCWLIVEQVRSEGNLGTILRTAEATGVSGLICVGPLCDPFDPAVVRASMGGLFHLPLVRTTHIELERWIRRHQMQLIGLSPDAISLWTELPMTLPIGLVIGEERRGLSDPMRNLCTSMVRLPMAGRVDSLNVGVATGVMLYEIVRRTERRL